MKNIIKGLIKKYRELIVYGIVGVCTLLVNIVVFYFLNQICKINLIFSNVSAWSVAFIFSFFTNKLYVFKRSDWKGKEAVKELINFFWTRLSTMILDTFLMWLWVEMFNWDELFTKIVVNIIVIIINYVVSKFFVFRRNEK